MKKTYLDYFRKKVLFLPFITPEEAIWSDQCAKALFRTIYSEGQWTTFKARLHGHKPKDKLALLTKELCSQNPAHTIEAIHRIFLMKWIASKPKSFQAFLQVWDKIKAQVAL